MKRISRTLATILAGVGLVIGVAAVGAPAASAAPRTVLGQTNLFGQYGRGWGTTQPRMIDNGGDPSGLVSNIRWSNWGTKTAFGRGQSYVTKPRGGYYAQPVRVQVKASNVGRCTANGPRAYRHLTARYQTRPGGPWGAWFGWLNLRDGRYGAYDGRICR